MNDDDLGKELAAMTASYEKSGDDLSIALFELPSFQAFKRRLGGTGSLETDTAILVAAIGPVVGDAMRQAQGMGVEVCILDDDGNVIPKPDDMDHTQWIDWLKDHMRIHINLTDTYMVSTIFTGITHRHDCDTKLFDVAAFHMPSRELAFPIKYTDDKGEATRLHNEFVQEMEKKQHDS